MAGTPGSKTTTTKKASDPPAVDRITIALIPKSAAELEHLLQKTGLSKTDIVNRAISLYEFIDESTAAGGEVQIRNTATGETRAVVFL